MGRTLLVGGAVVGAALVVVGFLRIVGAADAGTAADAAADQARIDAQSGGLTLAAIGGALILGTSVLAWVTGQFDARRDQ